MSARSIYQIVLIVLFSFMALFFDSPLKVEPEEGDGFSAARAYADIEILADRIHFIGSAANEEKKDYILTRFNALGLETSVFEGESHIQWGGSYRQAKTRNILAEKKGTEGKKKVLVLGHYDSVTNSPGASDDIHAVASMLDVASLIREESFKNDILFLVTDGEETGLHGARAYAENFDLDSIGIVLNFEARGNKGTSYAFEWSDNNYWLVKAFKRNVSKPIANSLSYEVYNRMPNGSDFTEFKERDIPGINHAFIDGFAYYHSPVDIPENIDLKSVQHSGDYMYNLVRYFGDQELEVSHNGNATFFNLYPWLIVYPSWFDLVLLVITFICVMYILGYWLKREEVKFSSFLLSLGSGIVVIAGAGLIGYVFQLIVKWMYPHYFHFYAGQFYNHKLYLVALAGLVIFWQAVVGRKIYRKWGEKPYVGAVAFLWLVLSIASYVVAPSAAYLFLIPLILFSIVYWVMESFPDVRDGKIRYFMYVLPLAVVLGIWVPSVHTLFLAFSLSSLIAPAVIILLLVSFLMPITPDFWGLKRTPWVMGLLIFLFGMIYGDLTSIPTEDQPLPSNLNYYYNQNDSTAYWITNKEVINEANAGAIDKGDKHTVFIPWEVKRSANPTNESYHIPIGVEIQDNDDPLYSKLTFHNKALYTYVYFDNLDGVDKLLFDGKNFYDSGSSVRDNMTLSLYGYGNDTITIDMVKSEDVETEITISTYNEGMPRKDIIPSNFMRTGGHTITTLKIRQ